MKNQRHGRRFCAWILVVMLLFGSFPANISAEAWDSKGDAPKEMDIRFWEDESPDIGFYLNAAARYILETVPEPTFGTSGGEWSVMDLLRGMYTGSDYMNYIPEGYFDQYIEKVETYTVDCEGILHDKKSTEYSRVFLSLTALGYNVSNVAGYDFIDKLSQSYKYAVWQGLNGPVWELIALNTGDYSLYDSPSEGTPEDYNTKGKMIDEILRQEITTNAGVKGGWALSGKTPDPDMTGMSLQALAPYYLDSGLYEQTGAGTDYEEFCTAVERGIAAMADMQLAHGGFASWGTVNSESAVQIIVALTALDINPLEDNLYLERIGRTVSFVKEGGVHDGVYTDNMIDYLLTFWAYGSGTSPEVGGFKHVTEGYDGGGGSGTAVNGMATDQALYGLIAYDRYLKGELPLYDMRDMCSGEYQWMEPQQYEITYDGNGESDTEQDWASPYAALTLPAGKDASGKAFASWNTSPDGDGTSYKAGEVLSMPEHNITLYAQYAESYTIDLQTNGGSLVGYDVPESYTSGDSDILLPDSSQIIRKGYIFDGWFDNENLAGQKVTQITTGSTGNKKYYAKWNLDETPVARLSDTVRGWVIEELTLEDKETVSAARTLYNSMIQEQQNRVDNTILQKLVSAEEKIKRLEEELTLDTVKKEAKQSLSSYKDPEDYRTAQQKELKEAIEAGEAAIDAAEDALGVDTALKNAMKAIDQIETAQQMNDRELAEAKSSAKTQLENYKNPDDYRSAQREELNEILENGKQMIENADTISDVKTITDAVKDKMDAVKTNAQLSKEELDAAKDEAKNELRSYKKSEDYREEQKKELSKAISNGENAIDLAESKTEVASVLEIAKQNIDAIKTDKQLTQEELIAAKEKAREELSSYKNPSDYREAQREELAKAIEAGNQAIDKASEITGVHAAVKAAKEVIDAIKTDEQMSQEETIQKIVLDRTSVVLNKKGSVTLKAEIFPETVFNKNVVWSSSNPKVAAVDKNGKVTAGEEGTANITVTAENGNITAVCKVTVTYQGAWKQNSRGWWYCYSDGTWPADCRIKIGTYYYAFDADGYMKTGWAYIGGRWSYHRTDGGALTGWQKIGNTWYYLNTNSIMATGWLKQGNTWYYLNGSGAMQTGWYKSENTWYYSSSSGAMQTGWQKIGGTWYYLKSSGAMATGWLKQGNTWYYLNGSGAMQTGWYKVGSTWYYSSSSGAMQTGWQKIGGTWYYLKSSGAMATGWMQLGGKWYYLYSNGAMASNTWVGKYYVNGSGVWTQSK
ncbi:InlB B-repeat-containing protein [Lactonifactor longoviformis]|uniref:InlB B-repeat-containing protein n=2 Tax=Lactonifactor longoviformis TaxID=341220 RepID=UPI0036F275ED